MPVLQCAPCPYSSAHLKALECCLGSTAVRPWTYSSTPLGVLSKYCRSSLSESTRVCRISRTSSRHHLLCLRRGVVHRSYNHERIQNSRKDKEYITNHQQNRPELFFLALLCVFFQEKRTIIGDYLYFCRCICPMRL